MTAATQAVNADGSQARIDVEDVARFERLGSEWWDPNGPMGKLHEINPVRLRYIRDRAAKHWAISHDGDDGPLSGRTVLDIGCGGGLLSEPLARLGGHVTGLDPGTTNIEVARRHAAQSGLAIDYRAGMAEDLATAGERFDLVVASEVIEHVPDQAAFMATIAGLVAPGGLLIASTFNRTAKSYLLGIVGAEYVLRWVPRGTHRWTRFVTTEEFAAGLRRGGLKVLDTSGMIFDPLGRGWRLGRDTDVNYFISAKRPQA
jgi:2-polyprenyl-6-hydroxyphenyl methylase / 3-demethylubiquinone-9 3-methyltransferase